MINEEDIKKLADYINLNGSLELLAEESSELTQAALKFIRADRYYNDGRYPINKEKYNREICTDNLIEEITDVYICLRLLGYEPDMYLAEQKVQTMIERCQKEYF